MIKEVEEFAEFLMNNSKKWNKKKFVLEQYISHIEECNELRICGDNHLQSELLDKMIIGMVGRKIGINIIEYEEDLIEFKSHICNYGILEFKTLDDLFDRRKVKFLSKLNLNGG